MKVYITVGLCSMTSEKQLYRAYEAFMNGGLLIEGPTLIRKVSHLATVLLHPLSMAAVQHMEMQQTIDHTGFHNDFTY